MMFHFPTMSPAGTLFGNARVQDFYDLNRSGLLSGRGIPIGILPFSGPQPLELSFDSDSHLLTVARTRSGKMSTQLSKTVLRYNASLLCLDPKGELAAICSRARRNILGHDVRHLNPFGLFTGRPWNLRQDRLNPLAVIHPDSPNFIADVRALCDALIVTEGAEPHWSDSARILCSGIVIEMVIRQGSAATLPKMREKLLLGRHAWIDYVRTIETAGSNEHPLLQVAHRRLMRFTGDTDEVASVISTAQTQTEFLDDPAIAACLSGDDFRLGDLKKRRLSVFVILPANYVSQYQRFLRLFVVSALNTLMSTHQRPEKNVLFLLDEFITTLGYLDIIESALGLGAGFGIQLWPVIQDLGSLQRVYQKGWSSFLSAAGVTQIFGVADLETAEYFSRRCGQRTVEMTSRSYQIDTRYGPYGLPPQHLQTSQSSVGIPLFSPQDIIGLDPERDRQILLISGHAHPVCCDRSPYYLDARYRDIADPNPYHPPR
jgi:type IV secretion system protein VirD4